MFRHMLAHKVDGDHPASYSALLLAAWKLERQNKAIDPLLPKTSTTGGSNVTHSQTPLNLFPSQKLKGNQTRPLLPGQLLWRATKQEKTQMLSVNERMKLSLPQETQKPPVVFVEQINQSATLPVLLTQWSCTRKKTPEIVLAVAVPATS